MAEEINEFHTDMWVRLWFAVFAATTFLAITTAAVLLNAIWFDQYRQPVWVALVLLVIANSWADRELSKRWSVWRKP